MSTATRRSSAASSISSVARAWSEPMANPFDLKGRTALVTGGGRGIGAAIVTRFAEAGASVIIANRSLDIAEALAAGLTSRGLSARAVALPGLDRAALHDLVGDAVRENGR